MYEKVIVYDTVYLIKPLKFKQNDLIFSELKVEETKFVRNVYKEEIEKQRAINRARRQKIKTLEYGFEAGVGLKISDWGKDLSDKPQFGGNIGFLSLKKNQQYRIIIGIICECLSLELIF
ncbi:hypothetical protein [Chryseobacterium wanjuense]